MSDAQCLGIDIGTRNVRVAVMTNNWPMVLRHDDGKRSTPNCVSFVDTKRFVGWEGEHFADLDPANAVETSKQFLFTNFDDSFDQRQQCATKFSSHRGRCTYLINSTSTTPKEVHPEQVIIELLSQTIEFASDQLGDDIQRAVITVPSFYTDKQRRAIQIAAKTAGFESIQLLNETSATAVSYAFNVSSTDLCRVLIIDFGAKSFQASIVEYENQEVVVRCHVHEPIGGDDLTEPLVRYMANEILKQFERNVFDDLRAARRLQKACEFAKIELSYADQWTLKIAPLFDDDDQSFSYDITRSMLDKLTTNLIMKVNACIATCMRSASTTTFKCQRSEIDNVVLVGGSSRLPKFRALINQQFAGKICTRMNADESVALGALIYSVKQYNQLYSVNVLSDICSRSFAIFINEAHSLYLPRFVKLNEKHGFDLTIDSAANVSIFENDRQMSCVQISQDKKVKYAVSVYIDDDGCLQAFNYMYYGDKNKQKMKRSLKPDLYMREDLRTIESEFFNYTDNEKQPSPTRVRIMSRAESISSNTSNYERELAKVRRNSTFYS